MHTSCLHLNFGEHESYLNIGSSDHTQALNSYEMMPYTEKEGSHIHPRLNGPVSFNSFFRNFAVFMRRVDCDLASNLKCSQLNMFAVRTCFIFFFPLVLIMSNDFIFDKLSLTKQRPAFETLHIIPQSTLLINYLCDVMFTNTGSSKIKHCMISVAA